MVFRQSVTSSLGSRLSICIDIQARGPADVLALANDVISAFRTECLFGNAHSVGGIAR
jgi:hypothetical protein